MNGIWRCASYAFSPNYLKYCGPDKNQELAGYLQTKTTDLGLETLLKKFATMYPYLELIAHANGLSDSFNDRVVDAYWLGNELLDKVSLKDFYNHVSQKIPRKELKWFELKLPQGAKASHSFHVFNFWLRTGHKAVPHTVETMDNCRISAGVIVGPGKIKTDQLIYKGGKLILKKDVIKSVKNINSDYQTGDLVSMHWGWICEKINKEQAKNLNKYIRLALRLANQTL